MGAVSTRPGRPRAAGRGGHCRTSAVRRPLVCRGALPPRRLAQRPAARGRDLDLLPRRAPRPGSGRWRARRPRWPRRPAGTPPAGCSCDWEAVGLRDAGVADQPVSQTKVCDTGADRRAPSSSFRSRCVRSRRRSPCPPAGRRASSSSATRALGVLRSPGAAGVNVLVRSANRTPAVGRTSGSSWRPRRFRTAWRPPSEDLRRARPRPRVRRRRRRRDRGARAARTSSSTATGGPPGPAGDRLEPRSGLDGVIDCWRTRRPPRHRCAARTLDPGYGAGRVPPGLSPPERRGSEVPAGARVFGVGHLSAITGGRMLDTHAVARSLTDAEFTPARGRRYHRRGPFPSTATTSRPRSRRGPNGDRRVADGNRRSRHAPLDADRRRAHRDCGP